VAAAAEVGINQTRKELGVSDPAVRTAWRRHGLGLPPRPTSDARTATRRLDAAFLQLNRKLPPARAHSDQELAARVPPRSTPSWALRWWWSCTPKATRPSPAPARGRSPAAPSAPTAAPAVGSSATSAAGPTAPAVPIGPAEPARWFRSGR
jgi:hypothetical protein